ncbi:MAG: energy transducer TonB [Verrucomicrobiota bacterium JB022]|nr:energy transducer TonB [Verrucomicrobiota bacterium JB022]
MFNPLLLLACCLALVSAVQAGTALAKADGSSEDADILLFAGEKVYYHLAGDAKDASVRTLKMEELAPEGQSAVLAWASSDTDHSAVTKADQPPEPIHTVGPDTKGLSGIKGVVSIGLVIDSKGNVARAFIAKSTDERLNAASLAAVNQWKFRPGKNGGDPVNVIVFVPMQYKS